MTYRLMVVLLTFAVYAGLASAQTAFPAPLPGQAAPGDGANPQGGSPAECMKGFMPLREDAEKKGKLIREVSARHAPPDEACKLIGAYSQAEVKMIKYLDANAQQCGIPPQTIEQVKKGHNNTEALEKKVCSMAERPGPGAPLRRCGPQEHFRDDCVFEMDQM
jgi:hypothetical protein